MQYFPRQLLYLLLVSLMLVACSKEEVQEEGLEQEPIIVVAGESIVINAMPGEQFVEEERQLLIGVVGPETGAEANFGMAVVQGAKLAVQQLNEAGGISGQDLRLLHYDNQSDADKTMGIVQYLIDQRAMAIITAPTGWATFGPTHLSDESNTILISVGSRRRIARSGDYIFQLSLSDEVATDYMIGYSVHEMGFKRFALVTVSDYDYSLDISALFKKAATRKGAEIGLEVDTYDTFTGQHNVQQTIAEIVGEAKSLDAVIFTGGISEAASLVRGLSERQVKLPLLAGEDLFSDEFLQLAGPAAAGSLVYATYPNRKLPQTAEFISAFQRENASVPDRFAALAYDATTLVADTMIETGSRHSSVVRKVMLGSKMMNGVTGASEFSNQGASIKVPLIYKVIKSEGSEKFALQL
jgi:branched-chain amino acid transport system substrate-binding protein|tara:strand:+ start:2188 stop:3423 length:1236 start_codon:yes stop_codon:yes gene_type:complete